MNLWECFEKTISPLGPNRKSRRGSKGVRFDQKRSKLPFFQFVLYFLTFNDVFKGFDERKSESMNMEECFEKKISPLGPNRKSRQGSKGVRFEQKRSKLPCFQLILYFLAFNDVFKGFVERKWESMNLEECFENKISPLGPNRKSRRGSKRARFGKKRSKLPFFQFVLYFLTFNDVFKGFDERKSESMNLEECFEK